MIFRHMPDAPETAEHEAKTAIAALEGWAKRAGVEISSFRIVPNAPWENREISVAGQKPDGEWMRNGFSIDNLSEPAELDAVLIRLASERGWAEYRTVS
jgi:hypothetical protein